MPTAKEILGQVNQVTADLVGLSLCDRQNFPALRELGKGCREVCVGTAASITVALKNAPYRELYLELDRTQAYNVKMLDGALIHMMYSFRDDQVERHRLAFFPSPVLEEFQNNPEVYLADEIYAEVVRRDVVPFPLRFDCDCRDGVAIDVDHPKSHLTLGQYHNCRIPVSAPVTPLCFMGFILRNFYNTAYRRYSAEISVSSLAFEHTITDREMDLVYVHASSPAHRSR